MRVSLMVLNISDDKRKVGLGIHEPVDIEFVRTFEFLFHDLPLL